MIAAALLLTLAAGCSPRPAAPTATPQQSARLVPEASAAATATALGDTATAAPADTAAAASAEEPFSTDEAKIQKFASHFGATWCPPCQAEMPGFQTLQNLNRKDVAVLAVASTATEGQDEKTSLDTVSQFITQQKYTFPVLFDADGKVWNVYQQQGIPANYILDKQGNVRLLQAGAFPNDEMMMAALEAVRRLDGK
jgi:thiol-disulfide isomerase/thioredoxin